MRPYRSEEAIAELALELEEMLASSGWRDVARVAIEFRMQEISHRLGLGRKLDEAAVRDMQSKYELLAEIAGRPRDFFRFPGTSAESKR